MPRFAPAAVEVDRLPSGAVRLRSPQPLGPFPRAVGEWLEQWAQTSRPFLAERDADGKWRTLTYKDALRGVRAIGQALLDRELSPRRPLLLLSENSIEHALLQLGAMHAGIPVAPISPAYSIASRDHERLRMIARQLGAGAVWSADTRTYSRALELASDAAEILDDVDDLLAVEPGPALDRAWAAVGPDTVAKILFTSGSTGAPKGVVNTQRMLCSNQQAIRQLWPFLDERPPIVVDWLPWSHTFGSNHNFNLVLANGGTLYLDRGRPGAIDASVANLREVQPTLYFNVPRGFDEIVGVLERDEAFRTRFFARLDLAFYAAAALPVPVWNRFQAVAQAATGRPAVLVSAWGSTETAPMATAVHFVLEQPGVIGLPAPGTEIALAPVGDRLELRVKGPNVTPGFWQNGAIEPAALDADGFLPTGDAGKLADERAPERGLVFDGRIAENFKLTSGTWVTVGALRLTLIAACAPQVSDAVIAGHDRDYVCALLFASREPDREHLRAAIDRHNQSAGSASKIRRVLVCDEPPTIDTGEITDKGYLNQRAILERRAALVERLYAATPDPAVIVISADDRG